MERDLDTLGSNVLYCCRMNDAQRAMTSWVGTLTSGGVFRSKHEEAGVTLAAYVVGEEPMAQLRAWMVQQDDERLHVAQRACIEVCIWMANADRKLESEEVVLLKELIACSQLDEDEQDELVAAVHDPPSLKGIEKRLGHPVLRELMIALMWELALSDGDLAKQEIDLLIGFAKRFEIDPNRAQSLRDAVHARLSERPPAP